MVLRNVCSAEFVSLGLLYCSALVGDFVHTLRMHSENNIRLEKTYLLIGCLFLVSEKCDFHTLLDYLNIL